MVCADCGVNASEEIIDFVKENIKKTGDNSREAVFESFAGSNHGSKILITAGVIE